jgi:hypothetical protein
MDPMALITSQPASAPAGAGAAAAAAAAAALAAASFAAAAPLCIGNLPVPPKSTGLGRRRRRRRRSSSSSIGTRAPELPGERAKAAAAAAVPAASLAADASLAAAVLPPLLAQRPPCRIRVGPKAMKPIDFGSSPPPPPPPPPATHPPTYYRITSEGIGHRLGRMRPAGQKRALIGRLAGRRMWGGCSSRGSTAAVACSRRGSRAAAACSSHSRLLLVLGGEDVVDDGVEEDAADADGAAQQLHRVQALLRYYIYIINIIYIYIIIIAQQLDRVQALLSSHATG